MSNQKLKQRPTVESNNIIFPVQPSSGTGWLKLTFQKLKDLLFVSNVEFPDDSVDVYLTDASPIFEVESNTAENLKVHNAYTSGTIALYPLGEAKSCNTYFLSDNKDAIIKVYDGSSVLLASYPAAKNTVFSCVYTIETGWNVVSITGSSISDIYTHDPVSQIAEIKWYKGLLKGLGFKIAGWGFEYKGFKRLVGQTFEFLSDGVSYMRYHTHDLLKLFIWGKEVFISDSKATQVKRVSRYVVPGVIIKTGWTVGDDLPDNVYRQIDNTFTTQELNYEVYYATEGAYPSKVCLFDKSQSSNEARHIYEEGGTYFQVTGNSSSYIENDAIIAGGRDESNLKTFVEIKQGDIPLIRAGFGKPGGAPSPSPISSDDPHEQYFELLDGKGRKVFASLNEEKRYAYCKNGNAAYSWDNNELNFLIPTNLSNKYIVINKIANSDFYPVRQKFSKSIKFIEVILMSNCSDISITIGATTYDKDTLINVTVPANTEFTINDITIVAEEPSADANIKFIEL